MKQVKKLSYYQRVAIDTNVFIYFFGGHPRYGKTVLPLFISLEKGVLHGITTVISLLELLSSAQLPPAEIEALTHHYQNLQNLETISVTEEIAIKAAEIRRKYHFRIADALQLATAVVSNAEVFVTNDQKLQEFKEIKVVALS